MTIRHQRIGWAILFTSLGLSAPAHATPIDVLWYTYADPASEYRQKISLLASVAHTLPQSSGSSWNLTYFTPAGATPNFAAFDVLVIESGEAFRTGVNPAGPHATPNYSGILNNKGAIAAARGDRTFISGADADYHAIRGDSGNIPNFPNPPGGRCVPVITAPDCWDGALGHAVNAVNWAASGNGLGIVSFVDGEFPGAFWWTHSDSFLRSELNGYVTYAGSDNAPIIDALEASFPLNSGLTSLGLSDWTNSFHAFFLETIPNYTPIVDSSLHSRYAGAIATFFSYTNTTPAVPEVSIERSQAHPAAVDAPGTLFLFALGLALSLVRLRSRSHRRSPSSQPKAPEN